jgi:hypothetical protein
VDFQNDVRVEGCNFRLPVFDLYWRSKILQALALPGGANKLQADSRIRRPKLINKNAEQYHQKICLLCLPADA